jgi:hypothetical protein
MTIHNSVFMFDEDGEPDIEVNDFPNSEKPFSSIKIAASGNQTVLYFESLQDIRRFAKNILAQIK